MKTPGTDVSSVFESCRGIPVFGSIGTPHSFSKSRLGAKPVITYTRSAFRRSSPFAVMSDTPAASIDLTHEFQRTVIRPYFTRLVKSGNTHGLIFLSKVGPK